MTYMVEKIVKKGRNFYVPDFLWEILEQEAERYGGKGTVASAAIFAFHLLSTSAKRDVLKAFRDREIDVAYGVTPEQKAAKEAADLEAAALIEQAESEAAQRALRKSRDRQPPKAG